LPAETAADETQRPTKQSKAGSGQASKGSKATAPSSLSDPGDGIDFANHTCTVTLTLPLRAPKLLLLELVERVAASVMVRSTANVEKVRGQIVGSSVTGVFVSG
jgi:DNA-directed RNA polymerase I subunit RPA1